ncbi:energy transducer TonB [Limnohabitans sp. 2KL-17]|uniref:energy transducer TonB n=1 Tax=Limnohabitans sp. 2KL-17 TaxID=1100704 RepID=UPI000D38180E|nr:energy transducer TonB [Limnohabitans sp. 2KL-17]PUE53552.1 energy transducer TonB [Limnohabitans sp. 2KL-17]
MNAYTDLQAPPKRKLIGLVGVVVLHALLFWAIQAGLARTVIQKMPTVVQALLLEEKRPETPPSPPLPPTPPSPPAPTPPKTTPLPPAFVAPADTPAPTAAPNAIAAVTATPSAAAPATATVTAPTAPPRPPVRTVASVNMAQCEKPDYPSASRRMEEEGTVSLRFLVGADGKVIQSEVEKSSGYKRLDEAARAGLSKCQFKPAMVDGKPEQAWASIKFTWRLE